MLLAKKGSNVWFFNFYFIYYASPKKQLFDWKYARENIIWLCRSSRKHTPYQSVVKTLSYNIPRVCDRGGTNASISSNREIIVARFRAQIQDRHTNCLSTQWHNNCKRYKQPYLRLLHAIYIYVYVHVHSINGPTCCENSKLVFVFASCAVTQLFVWLA